jgi:N-dimethylarginine dimethylaminohydrolase
MAEITPLSAILERRRASRRLLMCPPTAYGLEYEINPWMSLENRPDVEIAARQWANLYRILTKEARAEVTLVEQAAGCPDMVFTANAGLICGDVALLSAFRHAERQREVPYFRAWFEAQGYRVLEPPEGVHFEGEGDALFAGERLVAGYLKRSDIASHHWLAESLQIQVLSLELTDSRWYHLDTCLFALSPETIVYFPDAFDSYAQQVLKAHFEALPIAADEALRFACNAIVLGKEIVLPAGCPKTADLLESRGYRVYATELTEFLKAGGAAKCLALHLGQQEAPASNAGTL